MNKITPNLQFKGNAEEAVAYYLSIFPDGKLIAKSYYPTDGLLDFQKPFAGDTLTKNGGEESVCGWCKDKYGLSWQINPENMEDLMLRPGAWVKLLQMKKIMIEELKKS